MKHLSRLGFCSLPVIVAAVCVSGFAQAYDNKPPAIQGVVVTPLLSTTTTASGQPITLPGGNAQVIVSTFDIAPGATLPVHKHPFPRYAYVLAGDLRVTNTETNKSDDYKAGDFIVEMIGQWHRGTNVGATPVKLLVIDQVDKGASNTILHD